MDTEQKFHTELYAMHMVRPNLTVFKDEQLLSYRSTKGVDPPDVDGFYTSYGTGNEGFKQTVIHITATPGNTVQIHVIRLYWGFAWSGLVWSSQSVVSVRLGVDPVGRVDGVVGPCRRGGCIPSRGGHRLKGRTGWEGGRTESRRHEVAVGEVRASLTAQKTWTANGPGSREGLEQPVRVRRKDTKLPEQ
uniref:Uncharacterized protein n=1 Tax=Timema poppense TaxID=170557 RepID=A0A7R9H9G1_TIMPO|nr:unnamed protein product [Timema poppensis]